jgi:hypothetical protein
MTGMAASVCRVRLRLTLFVIDLNREGAGDKKINRSDGCGEKWDAKFYCGIDPTEQRRASSADCVRSPVG